MRFGKRQRAASPRRETRPADVQVETYRRMYEISRSISM